VVNDAYAEAGVIVLIMTRETFSWWISSTACTMVQRTESLATET